MKNSAFLNVIPVPILDTYYLSCMNTLLDFLASHRELLLVLVLYPITSALLNVFFRKRNAEEWEAWALSKPLLAFFIESLRANGIYPFKQLQVWQRYMQRRAGIVPPDALRLDNLPEPLKNVLADPKMREALVEVARKFLSVPETAPPPPKLPTDLA